MEVKRRRRSRAIVFLELLKRFRKESGLSQAEVAKAIGRPQSFVSKYESGEQRLDLMELEDVCIALGETLSSLVRLYEREQRKDIG